MADGPKCRTCRWYSELDDVDRAFVDDKLRSYANIAKLHRAAQLTGLDVGYGQFRWCLRFHR